ncbi:hypothetical protein Acy02nite_40720 [Actinoplanes cyaneus]|uniref:Carrier domain-containing protein n=1 Tax=Actinoplanes cyaneus TaxID=52696 RepID=A0A919IKF4_9ACTN|nr:phosphopantetheine-binding protein [Actinoplanes cyaneus]MCW2138233.1 Phosphopantetheine attachment site [Actinoplanes cyaneus]GID66191.1 hypothetical protein Acy02nite_40720 [Actinoplanes cyaneus]
MTNPDVALRTVIGEVMGRVLVRDPLSAEEDFFDCGGDSVRAIEVLQLLAERIDATDEQRAELLEALFDDASPAALEAVLAPAGRVPSEVRGA